MNVLVWFKRDLRLHDHPALAHAAALGPVLPVYVVEPDLWSAPEASARQWMHTAEALADLRAALEAMGLTLALRTGEAVEVLSRLARAHRISRLVSHEETGTELTYARDRRVAAWARAEGILWEELPQCGVVRRLRSRDGWARRRDGFMAAPPVALPDLRPVGGVEPGLIPDSRALRLADDPCPHRQGGGRAEALRVLEGFLTRRGEAYRSGMSSPVTGERACSRLSPHIALGALSLREVEAAVRARTAERPGGRWAGSLTSFSHRLAWRDHFIQKLEDAPDMDRVPLHPLAGLPPLPDPGGVRLAALMAGETGLPFLDACARYLRATGWLNFRARAMIVSAGCALLRLDWRDLGMALARRFTDYEPGIHWPQVQMQAGVTGINRPRIYNPVKQGHDQDPEGRFTRAWVPELAAVPPALLQEPWKWEGARGLLGRRYPEPLVDAVAAGRAAREGIFAARRAAGFGAIAEGIITRHASRAEPSGRFPNDRAAPRAPGRVARRAKVPDGQLSLDL